MGSPDARPDEHVLLGGLKLHHKCCRTFGETTTGKSILLKLKASINLRECGFVKGFSYKNQFYKEWKVNTSIIHLSLATSAMPHM